ncbi:ABC transporter ATP-binding protein [Leptospira alexanderi]|uniref:ABC transporter, ATP-binding protein n=1 Tax=Leptospira alexanderi serovar Manhao 3 str. L 60 TaxID=1049759 RepID=V6HUW0_9LEPT|nr:ABC transporter ATP-binding protein [Leptospira alexanderi]EQA61106.1 ABC transporter, ATP-binding protein [Leptospira alexanderi serovar Manhao 3 str. L 60]
MSKNLNEHRLFATMYGFVSDYAYQIFSLGFYVLIEGLFSFVSVFSIMPMADYLIDQKLISPSKFTIYILDCFNSWGISINFLSFALFFMFANLFKNLSDVLVGYYVLKTKYSILRKIIHGLLNTFLKARWEFFGSTNHGKIVNTLSKELSTVGDSIGHIATFLSQLLQLCIYISIPFFMNFKITLISVSIFILFGLPIMFFNRVVKKNSQGHLEASNALTSNIMEIIASAKIILGYGRREKSINHLIHSYDVAAGWGLKVNFINNLLGKLFLPIGIFSMIIALSFSMHEGIIFSELTAILWSLMRALPMLGSVLQIGTTFSAFLPSYIQMNSLKMKAESLAEIEGLKIFHELKQGIKIDNLSFSYPLRQDTLENINIFIEKGKMTAIVGESGSGKSTLTDLVLGLQLPQSGAIQIDGIPLSEWKQNSFREKIGYVPQDPYLFHISIRDNLLWSNPQATDGELWASLQLANADGFVKLLPQGIDTIVGDRGMRLSGGQRQRIALARALLRKPELLILDEATSSLDVESEQLIQKSINNLSADSTILIIAHRLFTIINADSVYLLKSGKVVEHGSFQQLANKSNGLFAEMIFKQRDMNQNGYNDK